MGIPPAGHVARGEHPEMADREALLAELRQLRRGHGLLANDILGRVGPRLARLCELGDRPAAQRRQQLIARVDAGLAGLPEDLRLAVRAAFALSPADTSRFLQQRMEWLAQRLDRDARTALRRVDSGLERLAEELAGLGRGGPAREDDFAPDGWYVDSFEAMLMLHQDPVQLLETRSVVSVSPGLERVNVSWSIPADDPADLNELRVEIVYGGQLVRDEHTSTRTFWSGHLQLPRPLRPWEQHRFQVRLTTVARESFRPYFVLSPFRRCDRFELRAKFDDTYAPEEVWAVDGVPFQFVDENQPIGPVVERDAVGEIVREFQNLRRGLSYGLRWRMRAG